MNTGEDEDRIKKYLQAKTAGGVCLAFSGGVDSTLLLHYLAALRLNSDLILAVTFETALHPEEEHELTGSLARHYGIEHIILKKDVLSDAEMRFNPPNRCYLCKKKLFVHLMDLAQKAGIRWVLDGTNADDLLEYRPGIKALKELEIASPWAELGIGKEQIRNLARHVNLPVASRPAAPCMATRFPYGAELRADVIQKLHQGENSIRELGIPVVRLRYYDGLIRIEVMPEDFGTLIERRNEVVALFKTLGFMYITLDLEGFRSGSMDTAKNGRMQ